jgi:hypothetical protein
MVSLPDLDWYFVCSLLCPTQFSVLLYSFFVLLYSPVLLYCSLLFILLLVMCVYLTIYIVL